MHLKNLTVLGFKSFADKTSLNFQPGITAIVGPNGCGKSNVADAIRWVLGEQSAKALRGGEMADVIFNGTDSRKPLSMAEVSLTITDVDGEHLKAAGVEVAYNEVTVTRRVFRDGGSEYFINKTACRLRDIQQLFMGTGVGRTSYSIMAQGNITQILSSKPEDRRMVFEEAAGITKFKAQKREALRKLEHTDQNLLRVSDLIREVKRQIGSLQRQAGKARRYKQVAQELQQLETQLARHQFDVLSEEIQHRQASLVRLKLETEQVGVEVQKGEEQVSRLRERLAEVEQQVALTQQRGLELKGQIERNENRVQFNESRLRELAEQTAQATSDISQGEERREASRVELASVVERLQASSRSLQEQQSALQARRSAVEQVERDLVGLQNALRQAQSEAMAGAQVCSRLRNDINALDLQKQGNVVRLEKLAAEKVQLQEERAGLEARLTAFAANVEAQQLDVVTQRGTVEERQQRLKAVQQELAVLAQELDKVQRLQAEKHSRLTVLEQLQDSHEGFSAGALAALKQAQAVAGSLTDRIRVPDQHVAAVEAALGGNLQLVLAEQPDAARQVLSDLATRKVGRASIAALALRPSVPELRADGVPAGAESALSVIECEDSIRPLLSSLLGRTLLVPTLEDAARGWAETSGSFDFVTASGELLNRHGVFTGGYLNGASNGKAPASILGRKNQIAELQRELGLIQEQAQELSRRKGALQGEQTALQASLQEAQHQLRAQEVAIATNRGEFNALQASLKALGQRIETVGFEVQTLEAQGGEGLRRRGELGERLQEAEVREQAAQTRSAELTGRIEEARAARDAAHASLTEVKVAVASEEQQVASLRRQQQPLEQRIRELEAMLQQRCRDIEGVAGRRAQSEAEIADSRSLIDSLRVEREQVSAQVVELLGRRDAQAAEIASGEESLRGFRRQLHTAQEEKGTVEVELAQRLMSVQNLRERIQQKYQLNLDEVRSECIRVTFADGGPARVEVVGTEEMAAAGVATDWDAVAGQVLALQKRIDEMGPVNLVAIEEYEETEQRYQFLTAQCDDLTKAKEQLMEVITRINTQTREMFVETFTKIRDNFRLMFSEIFGGGKADLMLGDDADVLESGIEIMARPPGKQLQSISLLSGGEQTMTAVALLFSIYQVKPSPFCVLDELDAPLDESNINRFIRVLQRFLEHSQFIIITHNKRTIGIADVLYGVTMQERGVSRIVSVKFHKSSEEGAVPGATPLVPAAAVTPVNAEEDRTQGRGETIEVVMAK